MGQKVGVCLTVKQFSEVIGHFYIPTEILLFFKFEATPVCKERKTKASLNEK